MKGHHETGKGRFARAFAGLLDFCMSWRWLTIGLTLGAFAVSLVRHADSCRSSFSPIPTGPN